MALAKSSASAVEALLTAVLESKEKVHVAKVERHGEKIILPENMTYGDAIKNLERQAQYEDEKVQIQHDFPYFVYDGAHALGKVMEQKFGFVFGKTEYSFFEGEQPPKLIGIDVGDGQIVQVPWGSFTVPSIKGGKFACGFKVEDGKILFQFSCTCARKYEAEVKDLRNSVLAYLKEHSIYKGRAISIKFTDDGGNMLIESNQIPQPKFLDLSKAREEELVFPKDVHDAIYDNLFTPIDRLEEARALGVPIKRGILLAGMFGVGKTLTAYVAASKATKKNMTYVYCQKPEEFVHIMRFAAQYAPALVFCEDVDRIVGTDRTAEVDELINVIDGVETKNHEIITVFTTNSVTDVNQALLRPGRMDAVIWVRTPDAEAVERLVRNYCGKLVSPEDDLTEIGKLLENNIPAVIREVCERSKLSALRMLPDGSPVTKIPVEALKKASTTMKNQLELLSQKRPPVLNEDQKAMVKVADAIGSIGTAIGEFTEATRMRLVTAPAIPTHGSGEMHPKKTAELPAKEA